MIESIQPRILMFAPAFAPLANPEAYANSKLALAFLEQGWEVDIISRKLVGNTDYDYGSAWGKPWDSLRCHTFEVDYPLGNHFFRWYETILAGIKMGYPIDGCRWALHAHSKAMFLHENRPYNIVISRALPDAAHLAAMVFARKTGVRWIANWNDPSGKKMPVPYGAGPQANLGWTYNSLFRSIERNAACFTFPSYRQMRYMCQYLGGSVEAKSSIIPHVILEEKNLDIPTAPDKFVICYAGNITEERNPSSFIRGLELFVNSIDEASSVEFVLIGFDRTGCFNVLNSESFGMSIRCIGAMPYDDCQAYLANYTTVLLIIEADMNDGIFLPVKFTDYVQSGKPILAITSKQSAIKDYIDSFGGGMVADHTPECIANALGSMYKHWKNQTLDLTLNSKCLREEFSPKRIIDQYIKLFDAINDKNSTFGFIGA